MTGCSTGSCMKGVAIVLSFVICSLTIRFVCVWCVCCFSCMPGSTAVHWLSASGSCRWSCTFRDRGGLACAARPSEHGRGLLRLRLDSSCSCVWRLLATSKFCSLAVLFMCGEAIGIRKFAGLWSQVTRSGAAVITQRPFVSD